MDHGPFTAPSRVPAETRELGGGLAAELGCSEEGQGQQQTL